ncbi:MAG: hypothetical protein R3D88_06060 [Alphaproteobacteria bacterium]
MSAIACVEAQKKAQNPLKNLQKRPPLKTKGGLMEQEEPTIIDAPKEEHEDVNENSLAGLSDDSIRAILNALMMKTVVFFQS